MNLHLWSTENFPHQPTACPPSPFMDPHIAFILVKMDLCLVPSPSIFSVHLSYRAFPEAFHGSRLLFITPQGTTLPPPHLFL